MEDSSRVRLLDFEDPRGYRYAEIDIDLLFPDPENPRIPIQESTLETILALVKEDADGLYNLARDLVNLGGQNPAELFNVRGESGAFIVKEGNRRVAARKLLRNPEQLRGHVSEAEFLRWRRLSQTGDARQLPDTALVVIGDDHEDWIDRRHLGLQNGVGVAPWKPQAKARRDSQRRGVKDRALAILEALKESYPDPFDHLQPPTRTFTTFTRIFDSREGRARVGVDFDAEGKVVLRKGQLSLHYIRQILEDLRKPGDQKLTSRRIHTTNQILEYLDGLDARIESVPDEEPITLDAQGDTEAPGSQSGREKAARRRDILKDYRTPVGPKLSKIFVELGKVRRSKAPNAAMVLARILLELSADSYAERQQLSFAGDTNPDMEEALKSFRKILSEKGITPDRPIRDALKFAERRPLSLSEKLDEVIKDLISRKVIVPREGQAKRRELRANDIVPLLNDAVHRLDNFPSMERVDHVLEVVNSVFNAMNEV